MKLPASLTQNPIIKHSLRRNRANWRLVAAILLALLLYLPACAIFLPFTIATLVTESITRFLSALSDFSQVTFYITASLLLLLITLFAPTMSVSAISGERQRKTLDLLLVTLLPVRSIIMGKLISTLLYTLLVFLIAWPLILLCILTGGVALAELFVILLMVIITSIAFTTIGLYVSSLVKTTTNATMMTYGLVLPGLFIAPPLIMLIITILLNFLMRDSSDLTEAIMIYGWGLVVSINPIISAFFSAALYHEEDIFLLGLLDNQYPIIAPWLIYIIFYSFLTVILINLTSNRLTRLSQ